MIFIKILYYKPKPKNKMSFMRSISMCPTEADNMSENFFDGSLRSQSVACVMSEATSEAVPSEAASEAEPKKYSKKKIIAPPMKYDLKNASADCVYQHITELTKHNTVATEYVRFIAPKLYAQRNPIVFGYIPAPPLQDITKQVIGEEGYFFKMTTVVCDVYFIWHDRASNMFLFWGSSTFKVVKAMNSIRWRIFKCCDIYNEQKIKNDFCQPIEEDDEYADMPELISCGNSPDYEHPEPC